MSRFFVRQPNGLLAEFSTVVDDFVQYDLTREQAIARACCEGIISAEATEKVQRGLDDAQYTGGPSSLNMDKPAGVRRFEDCLETVLLIHGWKRCFSCMRRFSGDCLP